MTRPPRSVAFLLGSGASIPAGMPDINELTEAVLSGTHPCREQHPERRDTIPRFLRTLRDHLSEYYRSRLQRPVQYEDLYYIVDQIMDEDSTNLDNPLVYSATRELHGALWQCAHAISSPNISTTAMHISNHIRTVVAGSLASVNGSLEYLQFLIDALMAQPARQLTVVTLNHDLVVENACLQLGVLARNGFGPAVNDVRYWNPDLLSTRDEGCVLLALHGSISWFRFRTDDGDGWYDERIGSPISTNDIHHTLDPENRPQSVLEPQPLMLIGTFNKLPRYSRGIFLDLLNAFRSRLADTDTLVVCGYGFGDQGVNSTVIEWLYGSRKRRLLVVHPEPERLATSARGAIRDKWPEWSSSGVLSLLPVPAEEATWADMARIIGS